MGKIFDYIVNKNSLYSETGILGIVTGSLVHSKCNKGWYLPCTGSKYITFTLPSLQQKAIITITKVNNNYVVAQTNTTATITSLILNNANYLRYIIYDTVASATSDLKNIQSWINTLQPLTYQKRLLQLPKPTELKQNGLVARYNSLKNGIIYDISGNGKHIKSVNNLVYTPSIKGFVCSNINSSNSNSVLFAPAINVTDWSYCISGNKLNIYNLTCLVYLNNVYIVASGTEIKVVEGGSFKSFNPPLYNTNTNCNYVFTYNNSTKTISAYKDGVYACNLVLANALGTSSLTYVFNVGTYGGKQITGVVKDISIYNRVLSTQEIKAYHNSFNEIVLQESFEDMAVGSSKLPNGWIKNGGSFVCGENTTNDAVIKSIRKRGKYLKCNTAGIVAIPSKQAYGTWEFDWFKGGDTNVINLLFVASKLSNYESSNTGYMFRVDSDEAIKLITVFGTVISSSATNYITINTWYRIRITRTTSGVFTVYILGGNFTNWTLVSTTGGSGSNPVTDNTYTTSNYFVMDLDANDRVGNILIQSQIRV